jgi:hypothetical protein
MGRRAAALAVRRNDPGETEAGETGSVPGLYLPKNRESGRRYLK